MQLAMQSLEHEKGVHNLFSVRSEPITACQMGLNLKAIKAHKHMEETGFIYRHVNIPYEEINLSIAVQNGIKVLRVIIHAIS